jgi:hypothetical protein
MDRDAVIAPIRRDGPDGFLGIRERILFGIAFCEDL